MASPLSVRFPDGVSKRLRQRSAPGGETTSGLVARLVDEGLRMDAHPGIVFRRRADGPTGRRAALARGPDVWEVISVVRDVGACGEAVVVAETARWLSLAEAEVRTALAYYGAHADEIDARIAANEAAAERHHAAWEAQRRLLG